MEKVDSSTSTLIEVSGASFGYAGRAVVEVPQLTLRRGACLGIFGPNGSGKTTLVRGLTGLLAPLVGTVRGAGGMRFGYVPQRREVDGTWPMSGFDAAALASSAYGRIDRATRQRVNAALERLDAFPCAGRPFATLSGGQQQRVLLAGAVAARPDALVLDEPTDGLDVQSRGVLLALLHTLAHSGLCIVLISHDVQDLLAVCGDVAWLQLATSPDAASVIETIGPADLIRRVAATRSVS